jgi:hypothetical protein
MTHHFSQRHTHGYKHVQSHWRGWCRYLVLGVGLVAIFAACAPSGEVERVAVEQLAAETSFYPRQTGALWQYLPAGERVDSMPAVLRVEGPTLVEGRRLIAWRLVGRGIDAYAYREYRADGVFTYRETRPGAVISFEPAVQELPAENALRLGASWGGSTQATIYFPEARPEEQFRRLLVDYQYNIIDVRQVNVAAGTFDVFVIDFESRSFDDEGNVMDVLEQEIWFAPYVGEIRNDVGLVLVDTNFDVRSVPLF